MTTISLTVCDATPRESTLHKLALSAGVALVRWAHRRPTPPTHDEQARRLATQQAVAQENSRMRYGFLQ